MSWEFFKTRLQDTEANLMADDETTTLQHRIEEAHALLADGKRDESLAIVEEVLRKSPANFGAQAVRDRIHTEENRDRLAKETEADREEGDESPVVPILMAGLGIACAIGGTVLAIKFALLGHRIGFSTEVSGHTLLNPGVGKYPVHLFFLYPVAMYVIAAICYFGHRRYMRNR
jgi:hypothetical protein